MADDPSRTNAQLYELIVSYVATATNVWQTPAVMKPREAWTQICVSMLKFKHSIHPVEVVWVLPDSTLGPSPSYQGVRLFCSQKKGKENNIQEIWGYLMAPWLQVKSRTM